MSKNDLLSIVLQQAEIFILEQGDFYPFGSYVNKSGEIVPLGIFSESEDMSDFIDPLEKYISKGIENKHISEAAIAISVTVKMQDHPADAVEIRLFDDSRNKVSNLYYKYRIGEKEVTFENLDI